MKIVFVIPNMGGGGTERVVSLLANEYVKKGFLVGIVLFAGNTVAYDLAPQIDVFSAGTPSNGNILIRLKRIYKMRTYFKQNKGCVIYSFSTIGTVFSVLTTIGLGTKMLVSERSDPNSYDKKKLRNFFYRFAKVIVCQTEDAANSFPKGIKKKSVVVSNPLNPDLPPIFYGERSKKIVTSSRLEKVKNLSMLMQAFEIFTKKYPEYTLHLYGDGSQKEELVNLTKKLKIDNKVYFHGFCKNVLAEIVDSSLFVLCSDYEGVSNAMLEAIALGIPVIATDCPIGGCRTYIKDNQNGFLTPVGDVNRLAQAMENVIQSEDLKANMNEQANIIRKDCAASKIADDLWNLLNN